MVYIAKIVTVTEYKNITDNLRPFVEFQSNLDNVEVGESDLIALLQVENTDSYIPIFLKAKPTMKEIEDKLAKQETKLNTDAKNLLLQYLARE